MEFEFETYCPREHWKDMFVSIRKGKWLVLNQEAWEVVDCSWFVRLLFDPDKKIVTIQPAEEIDPDALKVNELEARNELRAEVRAAGFLGCLEIPHNETKWYRANFMPHGERLELRFSLNDGPFLSAV